MGAFLSERDTHGHTPPSHNLRHHRGLVPLAVGEGILPTEPEDVQVEALQACSAHPPWAFGRWCVAARGARRRRTHMQGMRVMLDPILRELHPHCHTTGLP